MNALTYLTAVWTSALKVGYHATTPGLARGRVMLLNGLVVITATTVCLFSVWYAVIGYQYFYGPLYIIPICLFVMTLNSKGKFMDARRVYIAGSLCVITYWCYEGRGNGNEYTFIALATTATLILESRWAVIFTNVMCAMLFVAYQAYHLGTPFVPDPAINYNIVPIIILLLSVGVISFQIAFYRDLATHYDSKLTSKYDELQAVWEELKSSNEEITTMNEKLHQLTAQLESIVRQKTIELQTYIDAIDVNLYSCINDLNGNFIQVNEQLVKVSGYSREELLGNHYSLLATPEHQQVHSEERKQRLFSGHSWRGEVEHKSKRGDYYWFDCVVIPLKNEHDENKYFLSIGLPITERKRHEQIQEKTYRVLESIAFRASHNIRGPMARIKGLANLIDLNLINESEIRMIARLFSDCSNELNAATGELVEFVYKHQETLFNERRSENKKDIITDHPDEGL